MKLGYDYGYSEKIEKNNEKYETFWFAKSWWENSRQCTHADTLT